MDGNTELYDALNVITEGRSSVRSFSDRSVSTEDIERIIAIAEQSPYASGKKNWGIAVITDRTVIMHAKNCVELKAKEMADTMRGDFAESFSRYSHSFTAFETAPVLLVPWFRISPTVSIMTDNASDEIAQWERDTFVKSISCVSLLILLAAESMGLGSCYNTGSLLAEQELLKLFKIKPGRNIGAVIPVGYKGVE